MAAQAEAVNGAPARKTGRDYAMDAIERRAAMNRPAAPPPAASPPLAPSPVPAEPGRAPAPSLAPLSEAEAAIFGKMRLKAMQITLDLLELDLAEVFPESLRQKLKVEQIKAANNIMALGGRIDPGVMRGQANDEVGEMIERLKAGSPG